MHEASASTQHHNKPQQTQPSSQKENEIEQLSAAAMNNATISVLNSINLFVALLSISVVFIPTNYFVAPTTALPLSSSSVSTPLVSQECSNRRSVGTQDNNTNVTSAVQKLRESIREDYPEIDTVYSNRYLQLVLNVPGRSLLKCQEKFRNALQWRRSYNVHSLRNAFTYYPRGRREQGKGRGDNNDNESDVDLVEVDNDGIFIFDQRKQNQTETDNATCSNTTSIINSNADAQSSSSSFIPTSELIEVCGSGAFVIKRNTIKMVIDDDDVVNDDDDVDFVIKNKDNCSRVIDYNDIQQRRRIKENVLILYANTSRLNWWKTGTMAGLQYHVLVLEQALEQIRQSNRISNIQKQKEPILSESIIVCVDTTKYRRCRNHKCGGRSSWLMNLPPPLSVLRGMLELMQQGYPTRIYRIYVGPIHPWLRRFYNYVLPTMKPRSRKKIILLSEAPTNLENLQGKYPLFNMRCDI